MYICTIYNTQTIPSVPHLPPDPRKEFFLHSARGHYLVILPRPRSTWFEVSGIWSVEGGLWCVVFRVYSVVFGVWCVLYGVYGVVWCVWCEVYGERGQTSDNVPILKCIKMADLENDKEN